MARRRGRRPVFRQRRSWGRRFAGTATVFLIGAAVLMALIYLTLPWTISLGARGVLMAMGWGPVSLHVVRGDLHAVDVRNIRVAGGAIAVQQFVLNYDPLNLLRGRIAALTMLGLRVTADWTPQGLEIGHRRLGGAGDNGTGGRQGLQVQNLVISDAIVTLAAPVGSFAVAAAADLTPHDGLWDGGLTLDLRALGASEPPHPLVHVVWQGAVGASDIDRWHGRGSIDINADDVVIGNTRLAGHGRLDLTASNGNVSLTGADRIEVTATAINSGAPPGLSPAWAARLSTGASAFVGGSGGGPIVQWVSQDGVMAQKVDVDVGGNIGDSALRFTARGDATGKGGVPDTVTVNELKLEAAKLPLPWGEVTGLVRLADIAGPPMLAEGNATVDLNVAGFAARGVTAEEAAIDMAAHFHLDGPSLEFDPSRLQISGDGVKLPRGVALPGHTSIGLRTDTPDLQQLALVAGADGSMTIAFGLSTSMDGFSATWPNAGGTATVSCNLPQLRWNGYVVPGSKRYQIAVDATNGLVSHPLFDAQLTSLSMQLQPSSVNGSGEAILTRLWVRPRHTPRPTAPGATVHYAFKHDGGAYDLSASVDSAQGQNVAQIALAASDGGKQGKFSFAAPNLAFGANRLHARDIFSGLAPISSLAGTADISLAEDWRDGQSAGKGHVSLSDLGVQGPGFAISGLNGTLDLSSLRPLQSNGVSHWTAATIIAGLTFHDAAMDLHFPGDGTVVLANADSSVIGGHAGVTQAVLPLASGESSEIPLALSDLDLAVLTTQARVSGLAATGLIGGTLPLRLENREIKVVDGQLHSEGGGTIAYRPPTAPPAFASGGDAIRNALTNFAYDSLNASLNGALFRDVTVDLALTGRAGDSPEAPMQTFSLKLNGPFGGILRHGIVSYAAVGEGRIAAHGAAETAGVKVP